MSDLIVRALPSYGLAEDTPLTLLNRSENETWRAPHCSAFSEEL
jgi:hypothetical protein